MACVSGDGLAPVRSASKARHRSYVWVASPRSPRLACASIVARHAPSCVLSNCSSICATAITPSGLVCRASIASPTPRARSRRRSRSIASHASSAGSIPSRSSSSSRSSSLRADGSSGVARMTSSTSIQAIPGRSARLSRVTDRMSRPAVDRPSSNRWISCRSDARACSSGRLLQSRSAKRERRTGRGDASATIARSPRVFRPVGRTFSLVSVQASIWPISRRRMPIRSCPAMRMDGGNPGAD